MVLGEPDAHEDGIDGVRQHAGKPAIDRAARDRLAQAFESIGDLRIDEIDAREEAEAEPHAKLVEHVGRMSMYGKKPSVVCVRSAMATEAPVSQRIVPRSSTLRGSTSDVIAAGIAMNQ